MFIKQLSIYRLNPETAPTTNQLETALAKNPFTEVSGLDWFSQGFVSPHSFTNELVFQAADTWSVSLKKQERILPQSVIKDELEQRVALIFHKEGRFVGRKELIELKEKVKDELLPRTLCRSSRLYAMCHTPRQLLFVGSVSSKQAENMLTILRRVLGGLDAKLPKTKQSPVSLMTDWVHVGEAIGGFELDYSCQLTGVTRHEGLVKISNKHLNDEDVVCHVEQGMKVNELGLVWREQIAFVLTADLKLKRIKFLDVLHKEAEKHGDDVASLAFSNQVIATESLSALVNELVELLGGWEEV